MKHSIAELKALANKADALYARRRARGTPRHINVRAVVAAEVAQCCRQVAPEHVREDMRLRQDLRFDDMDIVGLALALEGRVDMHRALDLSDCGRVVDVVRALARAMGAGISAMEDDEP